MTRRELLAIVYSIKQFQQYLYGQRFKIRTDHAALKWLLRFKDPEGQEARWLQLLSEYEFEVEHRAGRSNQNADGLSCHPCKQCGREEQDDEVCFNRLLTLEPSITADELKKSQAEDLDVKPIFVAKENKLEKPTWEIISRESVATRKGSKAYLSSSERYLTLHIIRHRP